jgi:hypothetical protein
MAVHSIDTLGFSKSASLNATLEAQHLLSKSALQGKFRDAEPIRQFARKIELDLQPVVRLVAFGSAVTL